MGSLVVLRAIKIACPMKRKIINACEQKYFAKDEMRIDLHHEAEGMYFSGNLYRRKKMGLRIDRINLF